MEECVPWYKVKWKRGYVSEANGKKFLWDFEYAMRTTSSARRPDATLEYEDQKLIYLLDTACPHDNNRKENHREKLTKYQQLALEIRERRLRFRVEILPLVIGCMGSGADDLEKQISKLVDDEKSVKHIT